MKSNKQLNKTIGARISEIILDAENLTKHLRSALKGVRLAKVTAYRMAKRHCECLSPDCIEDYKAELTLAFPKSDDVFSAFIERHFASIRLMSECPYRLIKAVKEGMTLKAYLATSPNAWLANKRVAATATSKSPVKSVEIEPVSAVIVEKMSDADQATFWRRRAEALAQEVNEQKRRIADLERAQAHMERALKQLENAIACA